jgi:MFS family permease
MQVRGIMGQVERVRGAEASDRPAERAVSRSEWFGWWIVMLVGSGGLGLLLGWVAVVMPDRFDRSGTGIQDLEPAPDWLWRVGAIAVGTAFVVLAALIWAHVRRPYTMTLSRFVASVAAGTLFLSGSFVAGIVATDSGQRWSAFAMSLIIVGCTSWIVLSGQHREWG